MAFSEKLELASKLNLKKLSSTTNVRSKSKMAITPARSVETVNLGLVCRLQVEADWWWSMGGVW